MIRTGDVAVRRVGEPRLLEQPRGPAPEAAGHDALLERDDSCLPRAASRISCRSSGLANRALITPDRPALGLEGVGGLHGPGHDRPERRRTAGPGPRAAPRPARSGAPRARRSRQAEAGVARVVQRERVVLGERRPEQRAELLLVPRADAMTRFGSWRWAGSVNMPWWLVPSSPTRPARSTARSTGGVVLADVVDGLVERALEERRVQRDDRAHAGERETGRERHRVLLGDADVDEPVRERRLELGHAGARGHAGGDPDDPPVRPARARSARRRRRPCSSGCFGLAGWAAVGAAAASAIRRRSSMAALRSAIDRPSAPRLPAAACGAADPVVRVGRGQRHRRQGGAVERDLVRLGRAKPRPFWVRTWTMAGPVERERRAGTSPRARARSWPGIDADVGDPEVLEQLPRLGEARRRTARSRRDHLEQPVARSPGCARSSGRRRPCSAATAGQLDLATGTSRARRPSG